MYTVVITTLRDFLERLDGKGLVITNTDLLETSVLECLDIDGLDMDTEVMIEILPKE